MEKRYPGCKRLLDRLKGMEVCGGDLTWPAFSLLLSEGDGPVGKMITDAP